MAAPDRAIIDIVDAIEYYANRFVGIDHTKHHPDAVARLHSASMAVSAEIMRRMGGIKEKGKINE